MKMRSFVFAVATMSLVATVRGATVNWESGNLDVSALDGIKSVNAYYYVITDSTAKETAAGLSAGSYNSSDLITVSADGKSWNLNSTFAGKVAAPETKTDSTSPYGADGGLDWTQNVTLQDGEAEYVIVVYEAVSEFGGKYATASIGYAVGDSTNEYGGGISETTRYTSGLGSDAIEIESAGGGTGWTAVPEPTTVALLALGLAAVGLKRKVA